MTAAEEVLDALTMRCRHGAAQSAANRLCIVHLATPKLVNGKWVCPVSGEVMETTRDRRRGRRDASNRKRRRAAAAGHV